MKMIKVTQTYYSPGYYQPINQQTLTMPLGAGSLQGLFQSGNIQQYQATQSTQVHQQWFQPPPTENEITLPINSICYMMKDNINNGTVLYLNNQQNLSLKESPEQIEKMIHNTEFNDKMDKLLE